MQAMNLPISKKTIAAGVTVVTLTAAGFVLADSTSPSPTAPSSSPVAQASDTPSPTLSPSPSDSPTPSATPQNTPNPSPSMSSVQTELNNHETRITSLENTPKPAATPPPTPAPTVVSGYSCWRYEPATAMSSASYETMGVQVMSDGTQHANTVSTVGSSIPAGINECSANL